MGATLNSATGFSTGTISVNPGAIVGGSRGTIAVTLTGIAVGDLLQLEPNASLNNSLSYDGFVISADTVTIALTNRSGASIDDGALDWRYVWIDRTPVTEVLGQVPN
jgi:predicted anti-sigma-YlaC factor YlaD